MRYLTDSDDAVTYLYAFLPGVSPLVVKGSVGARLEVSVVGELHVGNQVRSEALHRFLVCVRGSFLALGGD